MKKCLSFIVLLFCSTLLLDGGAITICNSNNLCSTKMIVKEAELSEEMLNILTSDQLRNFDKECIIVTDLWDLMDSSM